MQDSRFWGPGSDSEDDTEEEVSSSEEEEDSDVSDSDSDSSDDNDAAGCAYRHLRAHATINLRSYILLKPLCLQTLPCGLGFL
jgi:hypothetical protein